MFGKMAVPGAFRTTSVPPVDDIGRTASSGATTPESKSARSENDQPCYLLPLMKAVLTERYGDNDRVQLREIDPPRIGPKDLLVRVRAASINPIDSKIRDGKVKTLLHYSF